VVTNYGGTGVVKGQNNVYAGHDGNVYKRDDNGDWSKWDNGQWNPVSPPSSNKGTIQSGQNSLTSQNQQTNRRNALGASTPGESTNRNGRGANGATTPGTTRAKQSPGNTQDQAEKPLDKTRQSSDDLTNSLNREASGRQRGAKNAGAQQRYQQRQASGSTPRGERSGEAGRGRLRRRE
jgi:hypothetical protein